MANKKISDLTAKGATIASNDLIEISEYVAPNTYTSKKILGSELGVLDTFLELTDTPNTFTGNASKVVKVNSGETALEFVTTDPSVQTVTSSATVTPALGNDLVTITAQAVGLTLANPSGTWSNGKDLVIRIKDNATPQTIAYGAKYRAVGITLPTTTTASKTTYLGCIYNSTDDKFDVIGVTTES